MVYTVTTTPMLINFTTQVGGNVSIHNEYMNIFSLQTLFHEITFSITIHSAKFNHDVEFSSLHFGEL